MEEQSVKLILNYLDKVAAKLGTSAEHIWPWFVRQQYVDSIYYAVIAVLTTTIFGTALYLCGKYWRKDWGDKKRGYSIWHSNHEGLWVFVVGLSGICAAIFTIIGISQFGNIFNPEYHALQSIIEMAK